METEEERIKKLKTAKIGAMKNPTVVMNSEDFELFKKELETKIVNFEVGDKPAFAGVPIEVNSSVQKGTFTVYDAPCPTERKMSNTKPTRSEFLRQIGDSILYSRTLEDNSGYDLNKIGIETAASWALSREKVMVTNDIEFKEYCKKIAELFESKRGKVLIIAGSDAPTRTLAELGMDSSRIINQPDCIFDPPPIPIYNYHCPEILIANAKECYPCQNFSHKRKRGFNNRKKTKGRRR